MGCFYTSFDTRRSSTHISFVGKDSSKRMLWCSCCNHDSICHRLCFLLPCCYGSASDSITNLKSDAEKLRERFVVLTDSVSETLRDKIGTIKKPESSRIEEFQTSVSEYLEKLYSLVPKEKTADVIRLKERFAYLGELKNAISKRMDFRKIILLKGNPMLTSKKYADALNSLKEQIGLNKNK